MKCDRAFLEFTYRPLGQHLLHNNLGSTADIELEWHR